MAEEEEDIDEEEETPVVKKVENIAPAEDGDIQETFGTVVAPEKEIMHRVPDDDRKTSFVMTLAEFTELMSIRSLQLERSPYSARIDYSELNSAQMIALTELQKGKLPLLIRRKLDDTWIEYFNPNLMYINPAFYDCIKKV
jgi:hypothetical protein